MIDMDSPIRDADIETADLCRAAKHEAALRRRGICAHSWYRAPHGQPAVCNHCGKVFATEADLNAERAEVLL